DPWEEKRLQEGALGMKFERMNFVLDSRDKMWDKLQEASQRGAVPISLKWNTKDEFFHRHFEHHAVLYAGSVTDTEGEKGTKGKQYALLFNPWGERHLMPLEEFRARLGEVAIPDPGQDPI